MNVYIYAANLYCEDCARDICKDLDRWGRTPEHRDDETTYDSDDYPKGSYLDGGGESDSPQHCGAGEDCINAIKFSDGTKGGAWLENELTAVGVEYVRESVREGGEVADLWAEFYHDYDLTS